MPNIKLTLEYDGSKYSGWQVQKNARSVEAELGKALYIYLKEDNLKLNVSGRTDAGVHALGQVVTFNSEFSGDLSKLAYGISSLMRQELAVTAAEYVADDFHARFSATAKVYQYHILNRRIPPCLEQGRVWHVPVSLDIQQLQELAAQFLGKHDFQSFRASDCSARYSEKKIYRLDVEKTGDLIIFEIEGSGFLKQMVRNIVGTIIDIATGSAKFQDVKEIFNKKDRTFAGQTAPAEGLYLKEVRY